MHKVIILFIMLVYVVNIESDDVSNNIKVHECKKEVKMNEIIE